jgi:hypothetical protein
LTVIAEMVMAATRVVLDAEWIIRWREGRGRIYGTGYDVGERSESHGADWLAGGVGQCSSV